MAHLPHRLAASSFAPAGLGVRDARAGPGCGSFEVLPPVARYGVVVVIDSVVIVELPPALVRDQPQNADVRVGHDRGPPGSGNRASSVHYGIVCPIVGELVVHAVATIAQR